MATVADAGGEKVTVERRARIPLHGKGVAGSDAERIAGTVKHALLRQQRGRACRRQPVAGGLRHVVAAEHIDLTAAAVGHLHLHRQIQIGVEVVVFVHGHRRRQ